MKGDIRQFPTRIALKTSGPIPVVECKWPDGTNKSLDNAFNWDTGAPSAFSATSQAERQRKIKEQKS